MSLPLWPTHSLLAMSFAFITFNIGASAKEAVVVVSDQNEQTERELSTSGQPSAVWVANSLAKAASKSWTVDSVFSADSTRSTILLSEAL